MSEALPNTLRLNQFRGAAMLIMVSVLASRFIGFFREMYIAWAFGAQSHTDAYVVAFTIPDLLNYLVAGGALAITFIPILGSLLEKGEEAESYRVLSIVATFMGLILIIGTVLCEIFAPAILHWYQPKFTADQLIECTLMTRILIPGPLCFCLGGLLSAVLYTRGSFLIPAITPLVYNLGTLAGAILLGQRLGVTSLAIGTMAGAFLGPFLLPYLAATKLGMRYRPELDLGNPYFRRWLRTTIPLMLGVSIVTADDWIIRRFAEGDGVITLFNYAKRLTAVPIAVLGQAIGQAAMPFFSKLYNDGNWARFRETVDRSVTRSVIGGIFAISLLEAVALPVVRLAYQRGAFNAEQAQQTSVFFSIFMLSLACWIGQGIYSRAIYATGNTFAPMIQSTLVTVATVPVYYFFQKWFGIVGLAWASNAAILLQTISLAMLLRWKDMLQIERGRWLEIGRSIVAGIIAWTGATLVLGHIELGKYRWPASAPAEIGVAVVAFLVWLAIVVVLSYVLRLHQLKSEAAQGWDKLRRRLG
jgi:putative peptidoglycan lipid II flippase